MVINFLQSSSHQISIQRRVRKIYSVEIPTIHYVRPPEVVIISYQLRTMNRIRILDPEVLDSFNLPGHLEVFQLQKILAKMPVRKTGLPMFQRPAETGTYPPLKENPINTRTTTIPNRFQLLTENPK